MIRLFTALAATLIGIGSLATAPAAAVPAVEPAGETVAIPFAPPLDRPLTYRTTREITKNGETTSVWTLTRYRFSRDGDGYRLHVEPGAGAMTAGDPAARAAFPRVHAMTNRPYVILLGPEGDVLGVENMDAHWAWMRGLIERMAGPAFMSREEAEARRAAMAMLDEIAPEARLAMFVQYVVPLIDWTGTEIHLGDTLEGETEAPGLFGGTLREETSIRPERVEDGHLFVAVRGSIPRDALLAYVESVVSRIPVTGRGHNNQAERDEAMRQLRTGRISQNTETSYQVALDTGLTRRYRSVGRVELEMGGRAQGKTETVLIERVDEPTPER